MKKVIRVEIGLNSFYLLKEVRKQSMGGGSE